MLLSWNEIRHNAIRFSREWAGETREEAEAKSFWDEFFGVFGIRRRTVASFEEPIKKLSGELTPRSCRAINATACHSIMETIRTLVLLVFTHALAAIFAPCAK